MLLNKRTIKLTATCLLVVLTFQLVYPNRALALTSGPSQPEVQGFEPVGTTDMVDLFSGDFVYNIPLIDVEGYPVNISYHGGVNMEQEASWVGLGWNINPGEINRSVRGIPDDFSGDSLIKNLHIKDEINTMIGLNVGAELAGASPPILNLSANVGANVTISNYRGVGCNLTGGISVNLYNCVSAGVNIGVGSQTGADVDYNAGLHVSSSQIVSSQMSAGVGLGYTSGYNTRTGLVSRSFDASVKLSAGPVGTSMGGTIPIGLKNIVPVITNSSTMNSLSGHIRVGGELFSVYGAIGVNASHSVLHYDGNGSRKSYGYLNAEGGRDEDIMDFTRDKDGFFNRLMTNLPVGNMTYDIYSVNGQGTGGSFRPFRNDFGSIYDPYTKSNSESYSGGIEAGIGNIFEIGGDLTASRTDIHSGPWKDYQRGFQQDGVNSLFEKAYWKQGGELTAVDPAYFSEIGGTQPIYDGGKSLHGAKPNSFSKRDARGNLVYAATSKEAALLCQQKDSFMYSYNLPGFATGTDTSKTKISRISSGKLGRKPHHLTQMTQVQKDGRRYVYGIPAVNNIQKEVTFSVPQSGNAADAARGLITYNKGVDDSKNNGNGTDNYYNATYTPTFTHSYLLTEVLSTDYIDVKGDGPTNDDFGSFTKFNYSCKNNDYRWRAPIDESKAQYAPGFLSDKKDDKASYLIGSREQWMLHSIETKNFVAEFYTSERVDGKGVKDYIVNEDGYSVAPYNTALGTAGSSYKLDSIKLYNKHDRFINKAAAVPVKTVYFIYDYSLCPNVPNASVAGSGKLTLKKLYVKYGNSEKGLLSPYQFDYSKCNKPYELANKDRWGSFKPNDPVLTNYDYPYVDQSSDSLDYYASAWSLETIQLPSGGTIKVKYEADDYAYVQDKLAMEMFSVKGIGNAPAFSRGNQLYFDSKSPSLYTYFKRRTTGENYQLPFKERYFKGQTCMLYNFSLNLVSGAADEPIKGYANITDVGICPNDTSYGYVKLVGIKPKGGGILHPASYTACNIGRYYMSNLIYPGSNPDNSDIDNILKGLWHSIEELLSFTKNPITRLIDKDGKAKNLNLAKSYIRLTTPGGHKHGGGQRVASLAFYDNWSALAGGNTQDATYGKVYDYTVVDDRGNGLISSGVASYEPIVGGDENPFRVPLKYVAQTGSNWPPSDPVELYQEMPVGESLYPSAVVGYSKVSVKSINREKGRSAQGVDINEFYTAKDFPVEMKETSLNKLEDYTKFKFVEQKVSLKVVQGYTLVLNDMHGKPKKTEHRVLLPKDGSSQLISSQQFIYNTSGGKLDNNVDVIKADAKMAKVKQLLGQEVDVTIDSREKIEETNTDQFFANLNTFFVPPFFVIPIPLPIDWNGKYVNQFNAAVVTKVVQQYGILSEVKSFQEGAVTSVRNEAFDPITGQAVITSVNNEFNDKEYTVTYPAYWGHKGMWPAFYNIGYTATFRRIDRLKGSMSGNVYFQLGVCAKDSSSPYRPNLYYGDELLVTATHPSAGPVSFIAWVNGMDKCGTTYSEYNCPTPIIVLRNGNSPIATTLRSTDSLKDVTIKVIRSGLRNQLTETMQTVNLMDDPIPAPGTNMLATGYFKGIISIKAQQFSTANNAGLMRPYDDSLNSFVNGNSGINRLYKEYAYLRNRDYTSTGIRRAGLFEATAVWKPTGNLYTTCWNALDPVTGAFWGAYMKPDVTDKNWKASRTVTKWSPWGFELENQDALGIYSAALYRYNNLLPVAVGQNTAQNEMYAENFEDFRMLEVLSDWIPYRTSPFAGFWTAAPLSLPNSPYGRRDALAAAYIKVDNTAAHSGSYALNIMSANLSGIFNIAIPVQDPVTKTIYGSGNKQPQIDLLSLSAGKTYILSYWYRPVTVSATATTYSSLVSIPSPATNVSVIAKSNIIDGWQQVEAQFSVPATGVTSIAVKLPIGILVDDMRLFAKDANMKSFVYDQYTQRLSATLDENNFATFYEYDQEGHLIRTKKETERGIITLSESRSANPKQ